MLRKRRHLQCLGVYERGFLYQFWSVQRRWLLDAKHLHEPWHLLKSVIYEEKQLPESWRHMDRKYLDVVQWHLDDNGNMDTEGTQHLERLRDGPRQLGRPGYCV